MENENTTIENAQTRFTRNFRLTKKTDAAEEVCFPRRGMPSRDAGHGRKLVPSAGFRQCTPPP